MSDQPRLIERAFPLQQASLDSVHEKNVRHGHISTLHIWPARRPLAASRAALIATLLPDPGTPEARKELCQRIGGKIVTKTETIKKSGKSVEREKTETEGGILHWKRESENAATLDLVRDEILKAYGGRAPKVLDPFSGGGAIPLEAMRLGCEVTAIDINPVAWFVEQCTIGYPQRLANQVLPLPFFIRSNLDFMADYLKSKGISKNFIKSYLKKFGGESNENLIPGVGSVEDSVLNADLSWHVRAWGWYIQSKIRAQLAPFYPTYAEFESVDKKNAVPYEPRPIQLVPSLPDGTPDVKSLNRVFSAEYLSDQTNPRWVDKPTIAYIWARTVQCKVCRSEIPLLKTRWLCKREGKRVLIDLTPNSDKSSLNYSIRKNVEAGVGNAASRREADKRMGEGTLLRSGARCLCCMGAPITMTKEDIRVEAQAGRLGSIMLAVVVDGKDGREYRLPTEHELSLESKAKRAQGELYNTIPFGIPSEPTPKAGAGASRAFMIDGYGFTDWGKIYLNRQLVALGHSINAIRSIRDSCSGYNHTWIEAITFYMMAVFDRLAGQCSTLCRWQSKGEFVVGTFDRFALQVIWDFAEVNPIGLNSGGLSNALDYVASVVEHTLSATRHAPESRIIRGSSITFKDNVMFDAIVTDPPYYDAIPYSDLMDYYYIWLRRGLHGLSHEVDRVFNASLSPKWDSDANDGELIDDAGRHKGDKAYSKQVYEDGMAKVFQTCHQKLGEHGKLVVVFAHKHPDAWETLVSAMIRAGFTVDGSWPIQTERAARTRSLTSSALSSSVWLVCKKRPQNARPGWDNIVLDEMRSNIRVQLREYWDAGIRGPDFVWAATGPALEAYSKHPIVKQADSANQLLLVSDFLTKVRRIVVDYVVGRVLAGGEAQNEQAAQESMDAPTAYYLLHRNDFGLSPAPSGACILYAVSCGLSDRDLESTWDLVIHSGNAISMDEEDTDDDDDVNPEDGDESGKGSTISLKSWKDRKRSSLGIEAPPQRPIPLIDRIHKLMHLWRQGEVKEVDDYVDVHGLRRQELFKRLLQALIELSEIRSEERSLMEALSNHLGSKGAVSPQRPASGTQLTLN